VLSGCSSPSTRRGKGVLVWGPAIGSYQAISHPLAKAKIEVDLAAMMTAKAAVAAVDHVIQLHGGNGLSAESGDDPELRRPAHPFAAAVLLSINNGVITVASRREHA